jgi:hypothetical protein
VDKKTIYIIVAVLIVVIVVGVAGVMLLNPGEGGEATPTPEPTQTPVADATSLQITVTDATGSYQWSAKNIDSDILLSIEYLDETAGFTIIINGAEHTAASDMTGSWADEDFQTTWDQWYPMFEGYVDALAHWTEGDWTSDDGTVTISDISVNPTLDDSLFQKPAS